MSIIKLQEFFDNIQLDSTKSKIAEVVLKEIKARLNFLISVGLDYLTLSRSSGTLSGGEAQRIRLATQIGSEHRSAPKRQRKTDRNLKTP